MFKLIAIAVLVSGCQLPGIQNNEETERVKMCLALCDHKVKQFQPITGTCTCQEIK